jgi:hypothetical protein
MRKLYTLALLLTITSITSATYISADADGFSNNVNISSVFPGLTLSSIGNYNGLDGSVYAWEDGLASTGTKVFANNLSFQRQWYADLSEGFALRADFVAYANWVSIDIIGDDSGDFGILEAYDASGTLIDSEASPRLETGQIYSAIVQSPSYNIAYIIAGGFPETQDTVHLDNLGANVIPEPLTLWLLGIGGLISARTKENKI